MRYQTCCETNIFHLGQNSKRVIVLPVMFLSERVTPQLNTKQKLCIGDSFGQA